jgi:chromosome segregation ATPase
MSFSTGYDGLPEVASVETIERELYVLKEDLVHLEEQVQIYRGSLHQLQLQAAMEGGEKFIDPKAKHRLELARQDLEERELERDEIQREIQAKQGELERAKEIDTLRAQLDYAANQKDLNGAWVIVNRLKAIPQKLLLGLSAHRATRSTNR